MFTHRILFRGFEAGRLFGVRHLRRVEDAGGLTPPYPIDGSQPENELFVVRNGDACDAHSMKNAKLSLPLFMARFAFVVMPAMRIV